MHNFPLLGPRPGPVQIVRAFPALRFTRPLFACTSPDGSRRLFVVEQDGVIQVFPDQDATSAAKPFLDLRGKVLRGGNEEGLLGLAFDPGYRTNGFFYVHYSAASPRRSVIARFRVSAGDPDRADPLSETVLLTVDQPYSNHNGGMLAFGPDDMLYIAFGDGGSSGDPLLSGQNFATLLGKILRIDPRRPSGGRQYSIPSDNPFVGRAGAREEIWALGMRNPWRFSFDRQTGDLWAGDVGQNTREEIDLVRRGGNYGWNVYEGNLAYRNPQNLPPDAFDRPVLDYPITHGRCVIGGVVYRGQRLPALRGAYLYGDNSSGRIQAVVHDRGKLVSDTALGTLSGIVSFGEDSQGEPLLVSLAGTLHRLLPSTGGGPTFPARLSATGLFRDLRTLTPAPGVLPYDVNVPFWSDGAEKRRWITWTGQPFGFHASDAWSLPAGTVLVKHFELELVDGDPSSARRLETRVLVHESSGWAGYTYRWTADQRDALLLHERETESIVRFDPKSRTLRSQTWTYPSRTDCLQCHTSAAGHLLGIRTPQLNLDPGGGNQLDVWNQLGWFGRDIGSSRQYGALPALADRTVGAGTRARAWLDVNCAMCHLPGGTGRASFDLRFATSDSATGLLDVRPQFGDLGLPDAHLVKRGVRESSVLWERIRRLDESRMPRLASHVVDPIGVELVGEWIGTPFRRFAPGCPGPEGTPSLQPVDGAWARVGQPWSFDVARLPASGTPVVWAGLSRTIWRGTPLPVDLTGIGMPGCSLHVSLDRLLPVTRQGSIARVAFDVPAEASLAGLELHTQAFVLDARANAKGLVASDAVTHRVLPR
jgi:uncharacterized repeat protein (TIGR03806 family)